MYYRPLPSNLRLGFSKIHDMGVFAKEKIEKGANLGMSHAKIGSRIIRTPLGGFLNHSETPNCQKTKLRFIHCQGDDQVPYTISVRTLQSFIRNGSKDASLITLDDFERDDKKWSHNKCFYPAMFWTTSWFTSVEENERMKEKK